MPFNISNSADFRRLYSQASQGSNGIYDVGNGTRYQLSQGGTGYDLIEGDEASEAKKLADLRASMQTYNTTPRPVLYGQGATTLDASLQAPNEAQIRQNALTQAQATIDATNAVYQNEYQRLQREGQGRLQQTRSIATSAGLAGSPFQGAAVDSSQLQTDQILGAKADERKAQIEDILARAEQRADTQYQSAIQNYQNERAFLTSQAEKEVAAKATALEANRKRATEAITTIAKGGFSLSELPEEQYQKLLTDSGMSDFEAKALYNVNNPKANATYQLMGDKLVGYYVDPVTGKPVITQSDSIPGLEGKDAATVQAFDGVPYVISKDKDGNFTSTVLPGFASKKTAGSDGGYTSSGFDFGGGQSVPTTPKQTFEQFLAEEENKAGQSFDQPKRDELRKQFEAAQVVPTGAAQNADLSKYDFRVQRVIQGFESPEGLLSGGTERDRNKFSAQLKQAESEGLLKKVLSPDQQKAVNTLADDVRSDKDVATFIDVRDGYNRVQTGANLNNSVGDLSLIFGYMKMLDPNSVVRETEFQSAEDALGYAQKVLLLPKKFISGDKLTPDGRKYFADAAEKLYQAKKKPYETAIKQYSDRAERSNIDPSLVLRDYTSSVTYTPFSIGGSAADILKQYGL